MYRCDHIVSIPNGYMLCWGKIDTCLQASTTMCHMVQATCRHNLCVCIVRPLSITTPLSYTVLVGLAPVAAPAAARALARVATAPAATVAGAVVVRWGLLLG